jgi:hypothetical protein
MLYQRWNVVHAIPQRGPMDRGDVEPVIKIRPEFSRSDRRPQIAIGSRQHTDVDGDGTCPSYAFEFALLQYAQKRDLGLRRDIADLDIAVGIGPAISTKGIWFFEKRTANPFAVNQYY